MSVEDFEEKAKNFEKSDFGEIVDQGKQFEELILRGYTYREEMEFEMFGQTVDVPIKPLTSPVYQNIIESVTDDESVDFAEIAEEYNQGEGYDPESGDVDPEAIEKFQSRIGGTKVGFINMAAKFGIDWEALGLHEEYGHWLIDQMIGSKSMAIGMKVMDITGNLEEAKQFPGSRVTG